jgi:predicted anti-sigma-YlaC factor YlaD
MDEMREMHAACKEYESLLEDHLEGYLNPVSQARVTAHLAACPSCHEAFADAQAGVQLLRLGHEATPDPGAFFAGRVMAAIRAEEKLRAGSFWRPLEALAWRFSLSAALALVLMTGYEVIAPAQLQTALSIRQAEVRELFPDPVQQPTGRDDVLLAIAEKNHAK